MKSIVIGYALASMGLFASPSGVLAQQPESATASVQTTQSDFLMAGFQNPGEAARPRVVERLPFMTDGWKDVFRQTAANADRLGLEFGVASFPGWSETGGPWVTAPDAMKKMTWSVMQLSGGTRFSGVVPKPPTTAGVFQTSTAGGILGGRAPGQSPPEYYADQKVIAFRVTADAALPIPTISASGDTLDASALSDGDIEKVAIDLPAGKETGGISWIQFDYGRTVVVRGLTLATPVRSTPLKRRQLSKPRTARPKSRREEELRPLPVIRMICAFAVITCGMRTGRGRLAPEMAGSVRSTEDSANPVRTSQGRLNPTA